MSLLRPSLWRAAASALLLAVTVVSAAAGADSEAAAKRATLRIGGTGAGLALMTRLGAAFTAEVPEVTVEVVPSLGSGGGIRALADGALDIAISARPLKAAEAAAGLEAWPLLRTPFVIVSSRDPAPGIAAGDLAELYQDPTARWADGTPVRVILRPESESDSAMLEGAFAGMADALARAHQRPELPVAGTDQENLDLAARIAGSLTAATMLQVVSEKAAVTMLPLDGVRPSVATLETGRYPYQKELLLVVRAAHQDGAADRFLAFLKSDAGRRMVRRLGGLPLL